ncbi:hypothetical protein DER44DRAFT_770002 [Fusarium oxysporum]|nr:hypothetical protein DER44DRAFT_770002 [Fusarium oxysporum]
MAAKQTGTMVLAWDLSWIIAFTLCELRQLRLTLSCIIHLTRLGWRHVCRHRMRIRIITWRHRVLVHHRDVRRRIHIWIGRRSVRDFVHTLGMPQLGEEEGKEQAGRPEGSLEAPLERDMFHILQDQALALGHLQFEDDPCFLLWNTDRVRVGTGLYGCCHEFGCSSLLFLLLLFL